MRIQLLDPNIIPQVQRTAQLEPKSNAVIRVLNGRQYDLKSTLDFNAQTGAVEAVPRRLCERTSERPF